MMLPESAVTLAPVDTGPGPALLWSHRYLALHCSAGGRKCGHTTRHIIVIRMVNVWFRLEVSELTGEFLLANMLEKVVQKQNHPVHFSL